MVASSLAMQPNPAPANGASGRYSWMIAIPTRREFRTASRT